MEGEPKVKLNNFGELVGDEVDQLENSAGYVNEKGEFIRGKDVKEEKPKEQKANENELPIHLL